MESFSVAAQHAGAIQHNHIIRLDPSAIAAARELRIAITVIVAGWVAIAGLRAFFGRLRSLLLLCPAAAPSLGKKLPAEEFLQPVPADLYKESALNLLVP
ncbi:hypothetical protein F5X97DRAFT_327744 [Nemania serpens]|nr:hypothetical protein F5X97DRAFT_327744 [Nemania serpens]